LLCKINEYANLKMLKKVVVPAVSSSGPFYASLDLSTAFPAIGTCSAFASSCLANALARAGRQTTHKKLQRNKEK